LQSTPAPKQRRTRAPQIDRATKGTPPPTSSGRQIAAEPAIALPPGRSRDVRILLVEDVPQVVERVRELLRSQTTIKLVAVASDGRRVADDIAEHRPDVVLVDTLLQGRVKGPAVIERLRRTRNPLPTVAITLSDRPLPSGVADRVDSVVTLPCGTFELIRAVRDAMTAGSARNPTLASRVVAVFSAKGGVGKTTIALNLAVALKELGLRTALVDGCLQFGDLRRLLGVADGLPSIIDLPTDSVRSSDLSELMMIGPSGVEVLLAPPRLEQAELITTRDLDKILDMLRRTHHAVVIDTPSSLGETTLALLDAADVIIQVVTPETAALDITRLAAEAFAGIGYPQPKLQLLLNRADTQGSISLGQVRRIFGRDPDFTVSSDWALVAHCNAQGLPFVAASPDAAVSTEVRGVAARVAAIMGAAPRDMVARRERLARV
jgi:pilus assembly protein CpaE